MLLSQLQLNVHFGSRIMLYPYKMQQDKVLFILSSQVESEDNPPLYL